MKISINVDDEDESQNTNQKRIRNAKSFSDYEECRESQLRPSHKKHFLPHEHRTSKNIDFDKLLKMDQQD